MSIFKVNDLHFNLAQRREWNRKHEEELTLTWLGRGVVQYDPNRMPAGWEEFCRLSEQANRHALLSQRRELCESHRIIHGRMLRFGQDRLQLRFCVPAVVLMNETVTLEQRWKALSQQKREQFAFDGIWRACKAVPGMESSRWWCPELIVANLAGNSETSFIPLIKQSIPDWETEEPSYILNLPVERMLLKSDCYGSGKGAAMGRNLLIAMTLLQIFSEFVGLRNIRSRVPDS
jgi:hypothetical protein